MISSDVVAGQLRCWSPGTISDVPVPFIIIGVSLDTSPQIVHTFELGMPRDRRMGDILAWSDLL